MVSSLIWRTPLSGDGMETPSTMVLLRRGSVPRIWTYLPSPSSRSIETEGMRPSASAMLAFGNDVITSAGSTCRIFSAARVRLMASASPRGRSAVTMTWSLADATLRTASNCNVCPATRTTSLTNDWKPTKETVTLYVPGVRLLKKNAPWPFEASGWAAGSSVMRAPCRKAPLSSLTMPESADFEFWLERKLTAKKANSRRRDVRRRVRMEPPKRHFGRIID